MAKEIDLSRAMAIPGWMSEKELTWLAERAAMHNVIVEMGSYQGRSTRIMSENTPGVVYAWDNWRGPQEDWWLAMSSQKFVDSLYGKFCHNLKDMIASEKVIVIHASHNEAERRESIPAPDMIFIDGDHTELGVLRDICMWMPLAKGTLMCGHDYNQAAVKSAVGKMLPKAINPVHSIWAFTA